MDLDLNNLKLDKLDEYITMELSMGVMQWGVEGGDIWKSTNKNKYFTAWIRYKSLSML